MSYSFPFCLPSNFVTLRKSVEVVQVDRVQGGGHAARAPRAHANPDPRVTPALTRYATMQPSTLSLCFPLSLPISPSTLTGCQVARSISPALRHRVSKWQSGLVSYLSRHMMLSVDQSEFSVHPGLAMEFYKFSMISDKFLLSELA